MDTRAIAEAGRILETITGSHAYGTSGPDSDKDTRGIFVDTFDLYMSFNGCEQIEGPGDRVLYQLKKYLKLASENNPNILEIMFVPEDCIIYKHRLWQQVIDNRDIFLSKRSKFTFSGYAVAQLKKIETHRKWLRTEIKRPTRAEFNLPEHTVVSKGDIDGFYFMLTEMMKDRFEYADLLKDILDRVKEVDLQALFQSKGLSDKALEVAKTFIPADNQFFNMMRQEHLYQKALRECQDYENWKKQRNKSRLELEIKHGYDTKHASHLVRLLRMGVEILEGKGVIVRRPDAEELRAIRFHGAWSFDQVKAYAESMETRLDEIYKASTLQKSCDMAKVEDLMMSIYGQYWRGGR